MNELRNTVVMHLNDTLNSFNGRQHLCDLICRHNYNVLIQNVSLNFKFELFELLLPVLHI